jgi:hypothetical protein
MTENTAAALRTQASEQFAAAEESFERCDTDGFLSQWASSITGRKLMLQAEIEERGGKAEFVALFDLEGALVPAKMIETRYGWSWALLDPKNPRGRFLGFFNPSKASTPEKRRAANAKKGFYLGTVLAPAKAEIMGGGTGLAGAASCYVGARRTDGGFSADVDIIDNGIEVSSE